MKIQIMTIKRLVKMIYLKNSTEEQIVYLPKQEETLAEIITEEEKGKDGY